MTATALHRLRRVERALLIVAGISVLASAILGWLAPHSLVPAWRLALFACLQPALGSLIFILIHRLTGGQWGHGLAPFLLSGARLLPWVWLLIMPLLWFPIAGQPHEPAVLREAISPQPVHAISQTLPADEAILNVFAGAESREAGPALQWYFSRPMLAARSALYFLAFLLLAFGAPRAMRATTTMRWFGPVGLIGIVFMLHLLATDWIVLLDPGWYSTGFGFVWTSAQAISGIALAVAAGAAFGAETDVHGRAGHVRGLDWGNLMLAAIMVWAYVTFVQLLIIWSGNLPAETVWYRHRGFGFWRWLGVAVAVLSFGGPFLLLLSRPLKKRRSGLVLVTLLLLVGQIAYTAWMIAPAFPQATAHAPWLLLAMAIAALALFGNRYLAGARAAAAALTAP